MYEQGAKPPAFTLAICLIVYSMSQPLPHRTVYDRFMRWRSNWRRRMRLLFPSPAETKFIEIMGGLVLNVPFVKSRRTSFCLAFVLSMGKVLKRELVQREVRIGRYFADFCVATPFYRCIIEIDGRYYHNSKMDIVYDQERDDYLHERGWVVMRIPARRLWREPLRVRADVLKFLRT